MKTKKTLQWTIARLKFDCTSPNNAFWGVSKRFGYRFQTVWIRYPFFGYGIHFLETVSIFWKRFPNEMDTVSNKWKRMFPLWIHLRSIHYGLVTIRNTLWPSQELMDSGNSGLESVYNCSTIGRSGSRRKTTGKWVNNWREEVGVWLESGRDAEITFSE